MLKNALLDLLEPEVVRVENLSRGSQVELVVGLDAPRQVNEPVDVVAQDRGLAALAVHRPEPLELTHRLFARDLGHLR